VPALCVAFVSEVAVTLARRSVRGWLCEIADSALRTAACGSGAVVRRTESSAPSLAADSTRIPKTKRRMLMSLFPHI
jgi:hypothetical protein